MVEAIGLEKITKKVKKDLNSKKDVLLFAFNATGKTRLSRQFENTNESITALYYNALIEDYFSWDNEEHTLTFTTNAWLYKFIKDEGLENDIAATFNTFTDIKIDPLIDFETGNIQFQIINEKSRKEFIKISKGEETLFKWSVFYSALKKVLDILNEKPESRSTDEYNNLKFIVLDDPISSLDEFKIYTLSMQIIEMMRFTHEKNINISFLISTHHTMFYNILYNTMKKRNKKRKIKSLFYMMIKENYNLILTSLNDQGLISYHIKSLLEIHNAFINNTIKKIHYNMFRSVLEKSSIFLGYSNWLDLFQKYENREKLSKIVNMNSHERYAELETEYLTQEQIDEFKNGFDYFIKTYKIKL